MIIILQTCFKHGRRYGRGSPRLSWPIFQNIPRIILEIGGRSPQFPKIFLEYLENIGQLSLGDPLPYLLSYLELSYEPILNEDLTLTLRQTSWGDFQGTQRRAGGLEGLGEEVRGGLIIPLRIS